MLLNNFSCAGIFAILQELKANDILTYICTNGSLIDEEAVLKLKKKDFFKEALLDIELDIAPNQHDEALNHTSH